MLKVLKNDIFLTFRSRSIARKRARSIRICQDIGVHKDGVMAELTWIKGGVPEKLPVKQVYGIVFSDDNRVILRIEDGQYKLTGGKPESAETFEETLKREYIEELNVELENIRYLGYLLIEEDSDKYAQVRMIANIKSIHDSHVDPATGKIYGRELVPMSKVKEYLNYSDSAGNEMIEDAIKLAIDIYGGTNV